MTQIFPNTRHLRAFIKVAELGNISRAAEAVHLSQPAVTHAIFKLETALDTQLFTRLHKGMRLTETGTVYLGRVKRALAEITKGGQDIARKNSTPPDQFARQVTAPQLRALVALAKARSFSLAARNIGISQPSVHRAGRDLERMVGRSLFKSTSQGVDLTAAADLLVKHVRLAAAELQQGKFEIAAIQGRDSAKITIGSLPLVRTWILPQAVHKLIQQKEHVQIATLEGPYPKLLRDIRHGQIDFLIGALRDPHPGDDIIQEMLFEDPLTVVVRAGHPLTQLKSVGLPDTLRYPWIAPPDQTPAGAYLREALDISVLSTSLIKVVSSSLVFVRGLLTTGDYVTLASTSQIRFELDNGSLVSLPIELINSARPIGLTYRKAWQPTRTQDLLLSHLRAAHKT